MRAALPGFDARLQAELLNGWDAEVLSRAGLSAVIFEQKLRAATVSLAPALRILPADMLVLSVLDQTNRQLRVYVNRVGPDMALSMPKIFYYDNLADITGKLPGEVARYIAGVARLNSRAPLRASPSVKQPQGTALVCCLLEPISTGGVQAELSKISPLIRAVLEDVVANVSGTVLVERNETAKLLEEKTLAAMNGLNTNGATDFGRMVKANLVLIPFIHFQNSATISTDLFAVDVATGRLLACQSWSGALLDAPPPGLIKELLQQGIQAASDSIDHPVADDPLRRHAEAEFIISLQTSWTGLQQQTATWAELSIRLGDAALGLASDNPAIMRKAITAFFYYATTRAMYPLQIEYHSGDRWPKEKTLLEQSGHQDLFEQQARRVFELPMIELATDNAYQRFHQQVFYWPKTGTTNPPEIKSIVANARLDLQNLALFWTCTGQANKAWDLLNPDGLPPAGLYEKSPFYTTLPSILMNLGRYQDCVDFFGSRRNIRSECAPVLLDAYRALNNSKKEFELMCDWPKATCATESGILRMLELGRAQDQAELALGLVIKKAHSWYVYSPLVRKAILRTRIFAGQHSQAIADAQCAYIVATRAKDSPAQKELQGILDDLGAKRLDSLPAAREYISFPAECRIDLIHDTTVNPQYARDVAGYLARFWGCAVYIRAVRLETNKFSSYEKLAQTVNCDNFADCLCHVDWPSGPTISTVVLTNAKWVSKEQNYLGVPYGFSRGFFDVLTDNSVKDSNQPDGRPLAQIIATVAANFFSVSSLLRDLADEQGRPADAFFPPPPDVFSKNGDQYTTFNILGISPATGLLLRKISASDVLKSYQKLRAFHLEKAPKPNSVDAPLIHELSRQLSLAEPIIIAP